MRSETMTAPTKLTGAHGIVSVNEIEIIVADFTMSLKRGVAVQPRVGKYSDRKIAGKLDLTGSLTNIDIIGDHLNRLLNSSVNTETKTVLNNMNTVADWTSSDGVNTVLSQETITIKEGTGALKITCTTTNSQNDTVTDTISATDLTGHHFIDFWIRSSIAGQVITVGFGEAAFTENTHAVTILTADTWQHEYWDISEIAAASKNAVTKLGFTINSASNPVIIIDDLNSHLGVRIGAGAVMTIYGDAIDASSNRVKVNAANCMITDGSISFSDANAFVSGPISFSMQDPDADLTLTYT